MTQDALCSFSRITPTAPFQSIAAAGQKPARNEEASFDCLGAPYCILADGAAAVLTNEASGAYELFLSDDTVEFRACSKKKELSDDTLKWLNFYYSLSESDRNALSMIPSNLPDRFQTAVHLSMKPLSPEPLIWRLLPRRNWMLPKRCPVLFYRSNFF